MIYHKPKNEKPLDYLYGVVSVDEDGNEGIIAIHDQGIGFTPLIFENIKTIDMMLPQIKQYCKEGGIKARICKFKKVDIIGELEIN